MTHETLVSELKHLIVEALNLTDITPEQIDENDSLFDTGLGLDSIDALELVIRIEKDYKVKIANSEEARQAFRSVASLAAFIEENRQDASPSS